MSPSSGNRNSTPKTRHARELTVLSLVGYRCTDRRRRCRTTTACGTSGLRCSTIRCIATSRRSDAVGFLRSICHTTHVTLDDLTIHPGRSISAQVMLAARKALLSGAFQPGEPFLSVRELAARLNIHPNTAHKIIQRLIQEGWLQVHPGTGTRVAVPPKIRAVDRRRLLEREVEHLVVETRRAGLRLEEVVEAITHEWTEIDRAYDAKR